VRDPSGLCTVVVEHDVLRLQVPVDDAFLVQVTQRHGNLGQVETVNRRRSHFEQTVNDIKVIGF